MGFVKRALSFQLELKDVAQEGGGGVGVGLNSFELELSLLSYL